MDDALKSIKVIFLPPYSPFLDPIEYSFHSIKLYVHRKEPKNPLALVSEIKSAITPEKSKKFFSHCQRLYRPCTKFQEITGMVLSPPKY